MKLGLRLLRPCGAASCQQVLQGNDGLMMIMMMMMNGKQDLERAKASTSDSRGREEGGGGREGRRDRNTE